MNETPLYEFVDGETARARRGLRLVVLGAGPSLWSEAAKAMFLVKRVPAAWVRFTPADEPLKQWTGAHNAPVALYDDEPPRTHWSDILMLAERLGARAAEAGGTAGPRLLSADPDERAFQIGLVHEVAGEDGLGWGLRALAVAASLASGGTRSFSSRVAAYLHRKYGEPSARMPAVRERVLGILHRLDDLLRTSRARFGTPLFGPSLSAVDLYVAASTLLVVPPRGWLPPGAGGAEAYKPLADEMRKAALYLEEEIAPHVPAPLIAHRDHVYREHLYRDALSLPLSSSLSF
jgi:hypothetical protein